MQRTNLLSLNRSEGIKYFAELLNELNTKDIETIVKIVVDIFKHGSSEKLKEIENHWYTTVNTGKPDYSVYESDNYLAEAWVCWEIYSKKYLKELQKPKPFPPSGIQADNRESKLIVDIGNGIGVTSAALKLMFPKAEIIGTNIPNSKQYEVAKKLGNLYGFQMVASTKEINKQPDLMIAFEYFEHFVQPIEHLKEVIGNCKPKKLLIANTFNGDAIGHFNFYRIGEHFIHGKKVGRIFNETMRELGYRKIETKLWNNRPTYWALQK